MNHATDSLLLAYHDGEIDGAALAELRDHLAACAQCTRELAELRRMSERLTGALALTDVTPPVMPAADAPVGHSLRVTAAAMTPEPAASPRAAATRSEERRERMAAWRRLGASSLVKAALFLIGLTGVLAAIPGTPPRRAVELLLARLFDRAPAAATEGAPVAAPAPTVRELSIEPSDSQVRVLVHGASALDVTVRLVDERKATVETSTIGQELKWISGSGRAEISGLEIGTLRIGIPRAVSRATVEFDGQVLVRLADGVLQLEQPAGNARGDEVSFRIGP